MAVELFTKNSRVSRADVNRRFDQIESSFPPSIEKGGVGATTAASARNSLGAYVRAVFYKNAAGSTGTVTLPSTHQYSNLGRVGIYYGYGGVKRYTEFVGHETGDVYLKLPLYYLTGSGNLVIRVATVHYSASRYISISALPSSGNCCFFSPSGGYSTSNEALSIYEVIGIYEGSGYN